MLSSGIGFLKKGYFEYHEIRTACLCILLEACVIFKKTQSQIDIHDDYIKYLGFKWWFKGKLRYFVFTVLPFGLASAPRICKLIFRSPWIAIDWKSGIFISPERGII